jgi:membrane-associated protease RseP (regulator of RpoE activity)
MKNVVCLLFCRQSLLLIAVLCLGIFAGYYLLRGAVPDPGGPNADAPPGLPEVARRYKDNPDDTLARLQQRLAQAEQEQVWLAERVAVLEAVIGTYPDTGTGAPATETNEETEPAAPAQTFRTSVETLIATGIPAEQAALIQARLDEYDLKRLYLKDRAGREGWLKTARYNKEQRQAQNAYRELRPEIGDDAYDRMLYALGRVNRVAVRDVMQNSAAEQYGLRANDRIIEYDSQRVFTSQELNALVTQGTAGTLVLVRVQRDEQQLDFYLPSGPIGVRLAPSRELP